VGLWDHATVCVPVCMSLFQLLNKLTNFQEVPYGPYDSATQIYFSVPIDSINCAAKTNL
jgi:hypothetical protein